MRTVYRAWPFLYVGVTTNTNDNDTAICYFLDLLKNAKETMVVYDDGNVMEGSPYNDEKVISALRTKLEQNPNFHLRCYFNVDGALLLASAFKDHDRVTDIVLRECKADMEQKFPALAA